MAPIGPQESRHGKIAIGLMELILPNVMDRRADVGRLFARLKRGGFGLKAGAGNDHPEPEAASEVDRSFKISMQC